MGRFVFLSDTHLGQTEPGYYQQPSYGARLAEILAALGGWIDEAGDIDFIIHGGDMTHQATEANILAAVDAFRLPVPVYLCLGNHDMLGDGGASRWTDLAGDFFPTGRTTFALQCGSGVVNVAPTQWCDTPFTWTEGEQPHFLPDQIASLDASLAADPDRTHILVTHSQVMAAPIEQTGFEAPFHAPIAAFTEEIIGLTESRPAIRCVLSGHSHLNTHTRRKGVHYLTASAFCEAPFEFKVVSLSHDSIAVETVNLADRVAFAPQYDFDKTFVQGRQIDRGFSGLRLLIPGEPHPPETLT